MANRFDVKRNRFDLSSGENPSVPPIASVPPITNQRTDIANSTPAVLPEQPKQPFANTGLGIAINTVRGIPKATRQLAADIARSVPRSILAVAQTLAPTSVRENIGEINPKEDLGKIGTFALGEEPVKPLQTQAVEIADKLEGWGLDRNLSNGLATFGVVGGSIADLYPGSAGEKKALQKGAVETVEKFVRYLTKETDETVIRGVLETLGHSPESIESSARLLRDADNPQLVRDILGISDNFEITPQVRNFIKETNSFDDFYTAIKTESAQKVGITPEISDTLLAKVDTDLGEEGFKNVLREYYDTVRLSLSDDLAKQLEDQSLRTKSKSASGDLLPSQSDEIASRSNNLGNPLETTIPRVNEFVNLDRLSISREAKQKILDVVEDIRPDLEGVRGKPLSNQEVLRAAEDAEILKRATNREATLKSEAALLRTRQNLAALAEERGVSSDFVEQLRIVSQEATRRGRELQALSIDAEPSLASTKSKLVKALLDAGIETEKIVEASKGVDFTNQKEVTAFYRQFITPKFIEKLDEYRYINLLSSPRTHIVNAFSNIIQAGIINPATKLVSGSFDAIASALTGRAREAYIREVPAYGKGMLNSVEDAVSNFSKGLSGRLLIERPDLSAIPTGSKLLKPFQFIPRMLEASDIFFRTLIEGGEREALAVRYLKQGKELTPAALADIADEAKKTAEYYVFRQGLDTANKSGQGTLLSNIDKMTSAVYKLREVPGVKWFVPFVQTPMNIVKQGIEYSPLGLTTLVGSTNKTEQLAKAFIGSTVFMGAGALALQGRATWSLPTNQKEREAFYNSGRQPYSVKIGDRWISYSKLGNLSYPIAMAAAVNWYMNENPKAITETSLERLSQVMGGVAQFFSDQSYMQGLGDLIGVFKEGTATAPSSIISNLGGQIVPLSSLNRWVTQIIDPVFRKPTSKDTIKQIIQNIEKSIPGLSENVPAIKEAQPRQNPLLNAVSPLQVTNAVPAFETKLQRIRREQQKSAVQKKRQENRFNLK